VPVDPDAALAAPPRTGEISWSTRDVLLYHLSLGAGRDPERGPELGLTYERDLRVLPTFALVAGQGVSAGERTPAGLDLPGIDVDLRRLLHSGQAVRTHRPVPTSGRAFTSSRVAEVWDRGKAAVVVLETEVRTEDDEPLWTTRMQIWARGEGGFGGDPGPADDSAVPRGEPDLVVDTPTSLDQALLYRLNGDLNPLHVDPEVARAVGFEAPILHGLATYGILARALCHALLGDDPTRLTGLDVRFAGVVEPGERLRTSVWRDDDRLRLHTVNLDRDGASVLTHASAYVDATS
jgi:acyl dehydratase